MAKLTKEEKRQRKLEKILRSPNRPTLFIVFFALAGLFLSLSVGELIIILTTQHSLQQSIQDAGAGAVFVAFAYVIFIAMFVIIFIALIVLFIVFLTLGFVRLKIFNKRRQLKLENPIDNVEEIDLTQFK